MLFPECGKVLIIDDQIDEVMPLLNLLGKKGVSSMYYSGKVNELPDKPFNEIRLVFCDLKFNVAPDEMSVVSNVLAILNALISDDNGPYILLVWSAHGTDYFDKLCELLEKEKNKPEFVLRLDKSEFFMSTNNGVCFDEMIDAISKLDLDPTDEINVKNIIQGFALAFGTSKRALYPDALENIEKKLAEELKKASLFHLFVLWENTISGSAIETVNNIYKAIPETIPGDKKLQAMLFYLARYRLEKQMAFADEDEKFQAAMDSLNEIFSYFYFEQVHNLSIEQVELDKIEKLQEINSLSDAKFNQWKMIAAGARGCHPGNVYHDDERRFQYHGLINSDIKKRPEEYEHIAAELKANPNIQYILVDVSSDCDIAQGKIFVSRMIPGIMISADEMKDYQHNKKIKPGSMPDYIFKLSPVEFEEKSWNIVFNMNQMFSLPVDELIDKMPIYALTGSYITAMKQKAASCVSKHGIAAFG